jgi:hypothetical protein
MFKSRYVPVLHVNSTNLLCMSHVYPVSHHWFKLWQIWLLINFLIKQEIAKTSEHIAIKSIFLWKVDHRAVLQRVLNSEGAGGKFLFLEDSAHLGQLYMFFSYLLK